MVGATIHALTQGLDSGPMLRHAVPVSAGETLAEFSMKAVVAAHEALVTTPANDDWRSWELVPQDSSLGVKYTRNSDFTDDVERDFLNRRRSPEQLETLLSTSAQPRLIDPFAY